MASIKSFVAFSWLVLQTLACDSCYGPNDPATHKRLSRRMQPDALNATYGPRGQLEWGQVNFLHTTDTHGWLEGHIKERSYGADWGDFVSFTRSMKHKAANLGVDLLLIDTGDLHDGAGLSDATSPNGALSNPIFENIDYDLLTIGNHELYVTDIAYETFSNFSKVYGDRYITSNVQILNKATGSYEYIGKQYRYFQTTHGLNVMAFGVLFDFTGNSNVSKVIKAATMVQQPWFLNALNSSQPVDMFVLFGHNAIRGSGSTLNTVYNAIRRFHPTTPIQIFGGHTHIRDFAVYDASAVAIESGRYCETLGWTSVSGLKSPHWKGPKNPAGVPNPSQKAVRNVTATASSSSTLPVATTGPANSSLLYSRRYLDWNRLTFAYHAKGSQDKTFDVPSGRHVSSEIYSDRQTLNLTSLIGCAPQTYCISCAPFMSNGSIFSLLAQALSAEVVNASRADIPRLIIINTGSIRFDLVQGPFTLDDSFIVSPFDDAFQYIADVPYSQASQVLDILNRGPYQKRDLETRDFGFSTFTGADGCVDDLSTHLGQADLRKRSFTRREPPTLSPGYVTSDDFGNGTGDDTVHSRIPRYSVPNDLQANASFPTDGSMPETVDLIFLDFIGTGYIVPALNSVGGSYTAADISYYISRNFTTNTYLPAYARDFWSKGPACPTGQAVGS